MDIHKLVTQRKAAILQRWLNLIIDSYPTDSREFFRKQKDRFNNPVGYSMVQATGEIFQALLAKNSAYNKLLSLDEFIKIRAVQELNPAQAVGFILFLKQAIREVLDGEFSKGVPISGLLEFEAEIDKLLLGAFDSYIRAREQIFQIRIREIKSNTYNVMNAKSPGLDELDGEDTSNSDI